MGKIRNEYIREKVEITAIEEKMTESRLRWFDHVRRRPIEALVKKVDQMEDSSIIRYR